jgi:diguanylate cyclase (GGDEF)-like protein
VNLLQLTSLNERDPMTAPAGCQLELEHDPDRLFARLTAREHQVCLLEADRAAELTRAMTATARSLCPDVPLVLLVDEVDETARRAVLMGGLDAAVPRHGKELGLRFAELIRIRQRRRSEPVRRRVLVAGAPDGPLASATATLRETDFAVTVVHRGEAALMELRAEDFHVLLTDTSLAEPGVGRTLDAASRFEPLTTALTIADATGVEQITELLQQGLATVMVAPVKPQRLLDAVSQAWERWSVSAGRRRLLRRGSCSGPRPLLKILLVEDDPAFGQGLQRMLRDTGDGTGGFEVEQVITLAAANRCLTSGGFDLVITDLGLPDSAGLPTLVALQRCARRTPIVVLSGSTDVRAAELAVRCGAQDYVSKHTLEVEDLKNRLYFARQRHQMLEEVQRSGRELHALLASQRSLVFAAADAMLVVGFDGTLRFANAAAKELFGCSLEGLQEVVPTLPLQGDEPARLTIDRDEGVRHAEARVANTWWHESPALLVTLHETTHLLAVEAKLRDVNLQLHDANRALQELASLDPLTGLPNRRGLAAVLNSEAPRVRRQGTSLTALLVDCDDFKQVNDRLGHAVGDVVLRELAGRLSGALRPEDCVGRIGGDEFLVLLPGTREQEARRVAERLRRAVMNDLIRHRGESIQITASFGLATLPAGVCSIDEVLSLARLGLARSKQSGKNTVSSGPIRLDSPDEQVAALAVLRDPSGFDAVVQDIIDLATGEVVGHELLSRARTDEFRMPEEFFRTADEARILSLVDLNCMKACLAEAKRRGLSGRVHLNLFPSTLLGTEPEALLDHLALGMHAGLRYCVEISEQQFIGDPGALSRTVRRLNADGVDVAIDDVGFGRTSLETLLVLEPQVVKIDRSYIDGAATDPGLRRLLERLIRAMSGLDCDLIAEGIECTADLELLRDLGVPYGQGFYWGRPA